MDNSDAEKRITDDEMAAINKLSRELEETKDLREHLQEILERSEKSEEEFSSRLTKMVEITNKLSKTNNVDSLCQQAVLLARRELGFERIGIWFKTDEPLVLRGSYGVNEHGELVDERNLMSRISPDSPEAQCLLSKEPLVYWGTAPLLNAQGEVIGRGDQVFAPMWDGENVIGHVSMDNHISNTPITRNQCELLRLFSSSLGHLVSMKRLEMERERVIAELQQALERIQTLSGLVPICSACKKIRNDEGYWQQVEEYIEHHSDVEFSHSLCPDCVKRLYPDIPVEKNKKEEESDTGNSSDSSME